MTIRMVRGAGPRIVGLVLLLVSASSPAVAGSGGEAPKEERPPELGTIDWGRGFDKALAAAKAANRPLLVLFQEVPGCSTCVNYGRDVLSHPLIEEAVETLFLPVVVYNNIPGDDEKTLKSFKEKAWNNPVVRIVSAERADIVPPVSGDYTVGGLASAMVRALEVKDRTVPTYLRLLRDEAASRSRKIERATFAMHCFWEGEGALGKIPGVVGTVPGFLDEKEVVEVEFDPRVVDYATLVKNAKRIDCASWVFTRSDDRQKSASATVGKYAVRNDDPIRPDKTPKYYLSGTPLKHVPMTSLQACRANAALGDNAYGDATAVLSPRQRRLLDLIERQPDAAWPNAIGATDLVKAWRAAQVVADDVPVEVAGG